MGGVSAGLSPGRPKPFQAIAWAGLIAGSLDITAAFVYSAARGFTPSRVLQGIAAGLLGARSFQGGYATVALGAALHFLIATTAAAVFYLASRKLTFLIRRSILSGLLYGVAVYLFMNLVVLPLSAARVSYSLTSVVTMVIIHMLFVGLPISLTVRLFSR